MPVQKNNWDKLPRWYSVMLVPKLSLTPIKICIFGHFGPNSAIFCTFCPMPNQKTMRSRCLGGFFVMWVTKLLMSPVKKRIFCPKMTKFCIFVHCRLIWCPVGGLACGCGARAVSRKTPIYFMYNAIYIMLLLKCYAQKIIDVNVCHYVKYVSHKIVL